jgi:hypothetical protein
MIAMTEPKKNAKPLKHGRRSLSPEVLARARKRYEDVVLEYRNQDWFAERRVVTKFRDYLRGNRKRLDDEMRDRLVIHAVLSNLCPVSPRLQSQWQSVFRWWTAEGRRFLSPGEPLSISTTQLIKHYLEHRRANVGPRKKTHWKRLCRPALRAAAEILKPHIKEGRWHVASWHQKRPYKPSPPERQLLKALQRIEPRVGSEVVRALVQSFSPRIK